MKPTAFFLEEGNEALKMCYHHYQINIREKHTYKDKVGFIKNIGSWKNFKTFIMQLKGP